MSLQNQQFATEIRLRHGFQMFVQGLKRDEPVCFEFLIKEIETFSVELTARPVGLNVFTTDDLTDWGITLEMLMDALMEKSVQKGVIECSKHGVLKNLQGRPYAWIPKISVGDDESVFISIKGGWANNPPYRIPETMMTARTS